MPLTCDISVHYEHYSDFLKITTNGTAGKGGQVGVRLATVSNYKPSKIELVKIELKVYKRLYQSPFFILC
jgi:hypothetical protein